MIILNNCPLCDGKKFVTIGQNTNFGILSDIVKCEACRFVFLKKQLDDKELAIFYAKLYRDQKNEEFDEQRLLGDYERALSQFLFINDYLKSTDKILEIGAGYGVLTDLLYDKGKNNTTILEWDNRILQHLKSDKIVCKTSWDYLDNENYDFIIMSHVLEHLYDVNGKIQFLYHLLKSQGRIFVEVPSYQNIGNYNGMKNSFHYWLFTMEHLFKLFKKQKFKVLKAAVCGKMKLLHEMNDQEYSLWKDQLHKQSPSIMYLDEKHDKAYWLCVLFEKE